MFAQATPAEGQPQATEAVPQTNAPNLFQNQAAPAQAPPTVAPQMFQNVQVPTHTSPQRPGLSSSLFAPTIPNSQTQEKKRHDGNTPAVSQCCICGITKGKAEFSRNQWSGRNGARKCKECVARSDMDSVQAVGEAQCCQCGQMKSKTEFTISQWKRRQDNRKCKECSQHVQNPNAKNPQGICECSSCGQLKERTSFSKSQLGVAANKRKCKVCIERARVSRQNKPTDHDAPRREFMANTTINVDKLKEVFNYVQDTQKFLQSCAGDIEKVGFQQMAQTIMAIQKINIGVLAGRNVSCDGKSFGGVVNMLKTSKLFTKKMSSKLTKVVEACGRQMEKNPNYEFSETEKKAVLETAWQTLLHIEKEVLPFCASDYTA